MPYIQKHDAKQDIIGRQQTEAFSRTVERYVADFHGLSIHGNARGRGDQMLCVCFYSFVLSLRCQGVAFLEQK